MKDLPKSLPAKVLLLGSGALKIGQAGEGMADATYFLPVQSGGGSLPHAPTPAGSPLHPLQGQSPRNAPGDRKGKCRAR